MSDFDNKKDYDLDYFNRNDGKADNGDLLPGDNLSDGEFDLNAFSNPSDIVDGESFEVADSSDDDSVDFSSFGKKQDEIKKENRKNDHKKTKTRAVAILKTSLKVLFSIMLIGIITGVLVVGAFAVYVATSVDDDIDTDLDDLTLGFTTTIYTLDKETGEYVEYQRLHGEENRIWVDFDSMPEDIKNSFVAVEDQRFRDHQGIDWKRTVAAFANMFIDLYSSNQGGSTITQQLVKNLTGDDKQTPMRKIREIMRARRLEIEYEKDTILECYLNTICLGGGIYGVEVAANYYFGKTTSELTLVECASIASLAKEPEKYRPDKHPENNKTRRNIVLRLMYEQGYITKEVYEESIATELTIVADETAKSTNKINNYFVDALTEEVIDKLVDKYGMDEAYASKNFYNGGYKIYCTVDPDIQNILDEEYSDIKSNFNKTSKKTGKNVQSAMTVMDYEGHIVGIVGGVGEKTDNRSYNRATMAYRQPGSTMKPLATYSQALQKNIINFSSMIEDKPLDNYKNGKAGPNNSYGYYAGYMTVAEALERSTNTIPCQLIKKMGVESTYYFLGNNFGLTNLDNVEDMNLSALGLGGTYTGITTTQSAAAFAVFGNLGTYYEPTTFTLMTDQHDKVILKQGDGIAAIDENTATVMNHMLQRPVYGEKGTATSIAKFSENLKCYAKTGTSSDVYDSWLVGGSPYYIASCWYGFDQQEELGSTTYAKNLWTKIMKRIHKGLPDKEFVDSEFVDHRYYCESTGLLATDACENVSEGWYKTNYSLPAACTAHKGELRPPVGTEPEEPEEDSDESNESDKDTSKPSSSTSNSSTTGSSDSSTSSGNSTSSNTSAGETSSAQGTASSTTTTERTDE